MTALQGVVRQILYRLLAGGGPDFNYELLRLAPSENSVADLRTGSDKFHPQSPKAEKAGSVGHW